MGDEHVQHRAGAVVELGPVVDPERLRDVHLDGFDVLPVPHGTEELVGEPQHVQVLGRFLAQEVVDPVNLVLVQHRVDQAVELAETVRRGAERLLEHHAGVAGEPVRAERLGDLRKGRRWYGQIVHQLRPAADRVPGVPDHVQ
jgi:hypothetical protein